jgi:hypothetical protein
MAVPCAHVEEVRDDWPPVGEPACEDCIGAGRRDWVSLRRCLSCGHVGCCDSSPGTHAAAHHHATGHPMVRAVGQDWAWCYVDEMSLRHVEAGGDPDVEQDFVFGKGFPLGAWVAEMRRRRGAGELSGDQVERLERFPGWRWETPA